MGRTSLAIAPSDQNVIYALAASNVPGPSAFYEQGLLAVFRSTAGGAPASWEARVRNTDPVRLNTLILSNPYAGSSAVCGFGSANSASPMGWYVNVIAVDPVDPTIVWAAGVDWFRSTDAGRTWGMVSQWWDSSVTTGRAIRSSMSPATAACSPRRTAAGQTRAGRAPCASLLRPACDGWPSTTAMA